MCRNKLIEAKSVWLTALLTDWYGIEYADKIEEFLERVDSFLLSSTDEQIAKAYGIYIAK